MSETATLTRRSAIHTLGVDLNGVTDRDEMLANSGAEFTAVGKTPVSQFSAEETETGVAAEAPVTALAVHRNDTLECLGSHKPGYTILQHSLLLDTCLEVVGLTHGDGVVEAASVLEEGALFFAAINLGSLTLDPGGVADKITRYMIGWNSHNGKLPFMLVPENMRVRCQNQLPTFRAAARSAGFMVKHTKNAVDRLKFAKQALGLAQAAEEAFVAQAEQMLRTPANHDTVTRTCEKLWPTDPDASDRAASQHASRLAAIHRLFDSETNVPAVGENAWAVYNAIAEYADHGRGTSVEKRAVASITPGTWVDARKQEAAKILLAV